jgi:hypothetical protein
MPTALPNHGCVAKNEKIVLGFLDPEGWTKGRLELEVRSKAEPTKKMPITTTFRVVPDCLEITPEEGPDNQVIASVAVRDGSTLPDDDRVSIHVEADPAPGLGAALAAMPGVPGFSMPKPFEKLVKDVDVELVPYFLFVQADMPGEEPEDPTSPQRISKGDTVEQVSDGLAQVVVKAMVYRVDSSGYDQGSPLDNAQWSVKLVDASDFFTLGTPSTEEAGTVYSIPLKSVRPFPPPASRKDQEAKPLLKLRLQAAMPARGKVWMEFTLKAVQEQPVGSFLGWIGKKGSKYDYLSRLTGQVGQDAALGQELGKLCPSELRELNRLLLGYEQDIAAYIQAHPKVWDTAPGGVRNALNWFGTESNKVRGCVDMSMQAERSLIKTQRASGRPSAFTVNHYAWKPGPGRQVGVFGGGSLAVALLTRMALMAKYGAAAGPYGLIGGGVVGIGMALATHNTEHNMACLDLKRRPFARIVLDPHGTQNGSPLSIHGPGHFQGALTGATAEGPDIEPQDWEKPPPPPPPTVQFPVGLPGTPTDA